MILEYNYCPNCKELAVNTVDYPLNLLSFVMSTLSNDRCYTCYNYSVAPIPWYELNK